jgi:hypothetical protein
VDVENSLHSTPDVVNPRVAVRLKNTSPPVFNLTFKGALVVFGQAAPDGLKHVISGFPVAAVASWLIAVQESPFWIVASMICFIVLIEATAVFLFCTLNMSANIVLKPKAIIEMIAAAIITSIKPKPACDFKRT